MKAYQVIVSATAEADLNTIYAGRSSEEEDEL